MRDNCSIIALSLPTTTAPFWSWASASYVEREVGDTIRAVAYLQEVDNGEVVFRIDRDDEDAMSVDPSYRCVKCP